MLVWGEFLENEVGAVHPSGLFGTDADTHAAEAHHGKKSRHAAKKPPEAGTDEADKGAKPKPVKHANAKPDAAAKSADKPASAEKSDAKPAKPKAAAKPAKPAPKPDSNG